MQRAVSRAVWVLGLVALAQACGGGGSRSTGPTPSNEVTIPLTGITAAQFPTNCTGQLTATGPGRPQSVPLPPFDNIQLSLGAGFWTLTATLNCSGQTATGSATVMVVPPNPVSVSIRVNVRGTLTVTTVGNGSVAVSPPGDSCGANCHSYFIGQPVTLTATPGPDATFTGWSGGGCGGTGGCQVTIGTTPTAVTATFSPIPPGPFNLSVTIVGSGTVKSAPPGIGCPPACTASFPSGTTVTLTASPTGSSTFGGWSVAACGLSLTCAVPITGPTAVTAMFNSPGQPPNLSVTIVGSGIVQSIPGGINCPPGCTAPFASGTTVTLVATPTGGSTFGGWSVVGGPACPGTGNCKVTMTGNTAVTATFDLLPTVTIVATIAETTEGGDSDGEFTVFRTGSTAKALTVQYKVKAGEGQATPNTDYDALPGKLTIPAGSKSEKIPVKAKSDAIEEIFSETVIVTLSANDAYVVGKPDSATVKINDPQTHDQPPPPVSLTVSIDNKEGDGTVTSDLGGIKCPVTCMASFQIGTTVTLTASPANGFIFGGWSACPGTDPCKVTMTGDITVTATFKCCFTKLRSRSGS